MGVLFKIMLKHCLKYQSFVTLIPLIWYCPPTPIAQQEVQAKEEIFYSKYMMWLGSIQFRNWNCSSIPIPELELELKLVELKSLELELELKTGIELFATATEALTSLPTISKFSFNRGHNLSCGWLLMQQVYLLSSWDIGPLWCGHKRLWGGYLVPLE